MRLTKHQLLIKQLRSALNDLQRPNYFDEESSLIFTIDEMEFEYEEEQLEEEQDW